MRGLKPKTGLPRLSDRVASFTDAWIETETNRPEQCLDRSHLLQMRGLKQELTMKQVDP